LKPARLFAFAAASIAATSARAAPGYHINLDSKHPTDIAFSLAVPPEQELTLSLPKAAEQPNSAPKCASTTLRETEPGTWLKPTGCAVVSWTASFSNLDDQPFDGSSPTSGWSRRHRLWLLTGGLPWLRSKGQPNALVRIQARTAGLRLTRTSTIPADSSIPVAIVVGIPVRRYTANGFTMDVYGDAPTGPKFYRLQRLLVSRVAQWRRDLFPPGSRAPNHLNYVWFGSSPNADPGIFASANSDAILIQYIPDPKSFDPDAKLAAGVLATGSHESFHALGAVQGAPAWANESLANFFAFSAARPHLTGEPLRLLSDMIDAPSDKPLLTTEREVEKGDQTNYGDFYSKGARFWAAIDNVLTVKPNDTGRLAALIKQTDGLEGLNWLDADAIALFFDRYSDGRASPIVKCFLVQSNCALANKPI
jgi:hypothetical protein